jgi:hypothetical protein
MDEVPAVNVFDLLGILAQLSVAFAGFGSIASGLGQQQARDDTRLDASRLINMLIVCLSTMMLALIPLLLAQMQLPARVVWGLSSVIAAATVLAFTPGVIARTARVSRFAGFNDRAVTVYFLLDLLALGAFVACAMGLPAWSLSAGYVTGLVALQLICAILFFRVTASLLRTHIRK